MRLRGVLLAGVAIVLPSFLAAQPVSGPYVNLGVGLDLLSHEIIQPAPGLEPERSRIFDPGFAGQVSLGYGFGNGLRAEIEADYAYNHLRKLEFPTGPREAGGSQQQYGGMVNALYDFDFGLPVYPYLGVGIGGQFLEDDNLHSGVPGSSFPHSGSQTIGTLAYQGIAGFSVPLPWLQGLSLTADYRMRGLPDPLPAYHETVTSGATGAVIGSGNQKVGNVFNNQVLVGLRYVFGGPAAPTPPPAVTVAPPIPAPARTYLVFFDWDRSDLTDRARQIIAEAAAASARVQTTRIEVQGNADRSGTPDYNQALSVRRARTVAAELVRLGVPAAIIAIEGFGDTRPLIPTAAGIREPQNRRVEIILR
jgi:OOP family OmpA-OmpF porin